MHTTPKLFKKKKKVKMSTLLLQINEGGTYELFIIAMDRLPSLFCRKGETIYVTIKN